MRVTVSEMMIRIKCLALEKLERRELKIRSMAKYGANTKFYSCWCIFLISKECTLADFSLALAHGYCSAASSHAVMILGHFLKFEIVDVAMAVSRWKIVEPWRELKSYQPWFLWSNWIKKAGPWGFPHSWKESGFHSTLCVIFSDKNAYSWFKLHQKIFLLCFMIFLNLCIIFAREDSWESFGQQDWTSQS